LKTPPSRLNLIARTGQAPEPGPKPGGRDVLKTSQGTAEEESAIALLGFEQIEDAGSIFHYPHETSGSVLYLGSNKDAVDAFPAKSDSTLQTFSFGSGNGGADWSKPLPKVRARFSSKPGLTGTAHLGILPGFTF
jgi:hypothetical protein